MKVYQDYFPLLPQPLNLKINRALLLLFFLSELLETKTAIEAKEWDSLVTPVLRFLPYDWGTKVGMLDKLHAYIPLLQQSFPGYARSITKLHKNIFKTMNAAAKKTPVKKEILFLLKNIYLSYEPLLFACKENENLLFFLLKSQSSIDNLIKKHYLHSLLQRMYPNGLESVGEKMCDQYHRRGFFSQISELKLLLTQVAYV